MPEPDRRVLLGGVPELRPVGAAALLAELPDARTTLALYSRLRVRPSSPPGLDGVVDVVPAERTVLVRYDPARVTGASVRSWLLDAARSAAAQSAVDTLGGDGAHRSDGRDERMPVLELPVRYDGPDLHEVAEVLGLSPDALVAAHAATVWTAAFIGFAPGFAYLTSGDDRFTLPRRSSPRAAVPAGSVALAAGYCGVYPRESPGGWHLLGTTDAVLWDTGRPEPALIVPGRRVRFIDAG